MTATVGLRSRRRAGLGTAVLVAVVAVVIVAGVGTYYFAVSGPGTPGKTSTTTIKIGTTTSVQGYQNYRGDFTYTEPLGPFGINDSSGKPVEWNSTQTASGTFAFSINPATYVGSGEGTGNVTVTTRGYCTGSATVPYAFKITVAHPPGENYIISFNPPTPLNVTVQLTCQGSTRGFNTANNPVAYLSVYPNGLSVSVLPTTASQALTAGISYRVSITTA